MGCIPRTNCPRLCSSLDRLLQRVDISIECVIIHTSSEGKHLQNRKGN
nr:MAG TPA: hypothetical protein [Caudoviricetes sp.]